MPKVTNWDTVVAMDAPATPRFNPQSNMNTGSSTTFSTAPVITATEEIFTEPLHPYTQGLKASLPQRGSREKLHVIPGAVPSALDFPKGCVFAPRCPYATERCQCEKPPLYDLGNGHTVRCFRYEEVAR